MGVVELNDREQIAAVLRRHPQAHAYELGDLDDREWPHTTWFGWEAGGQIEQIALLYARPSVPVLLAIADPPDATMTCLLDDIAERLPAELYVHATPSALPALGSRYATLRAAAHLKLGLTGDCSPDEREDTVDVLGSADLDEIEVLYHAAYPGNWFDPQMLDTGRYVGIRRDGLLACIAGVHVYSPTWNAAALGSVATLPAARGQGLAGIACGALCRLLLADGIDVIALNVRADNAAALRTYRRLGFEEAVPYVEASLVARG